MIPFGSQRASGQELATHLLNAQDNELVEIAALRGTEFDDLHGAFAQWREQARSLTRCRKYLYSLSINPDPAQEPLTRAQYEDYIARAEERLGLTGQPRAVVFHVKHCREHCHVVWSRIDIAAGRAVQISFDRTKLMAVTREFARDHGLRLPKGYYREPGEPPQNSQVSLYEKVQEDRTGLTKEERITDVTGAWQRRDTPQTFVQNLEELGYILARGERPYVLVDLYGEMNALPKLIADDKGGQRVRTKDVRAFLEAAFPAGSLPSVEQARTLAAQRLKAREDAAKARTNDQEDNRAASLKVLRAGRREKLAMNAAALATHHAVEFMHLATRHSEAIIACEREFEAYMARLKSGRRACAPTGLAAFLGRITGMTMLGAAMRAQQDARRYRKHQQNIAVLKAEHAAEIKVLKTRQAQVRRELARRGRALARIERREWRSLESARLRHIRIRAREAPGWYPVFTLSRESIAEPADDAHQDEEARKAPHLAGAFVRACHNDDDEDEDGDAEAAGRLAAAPDIWAEASSPGSEAADQEPPFPDHADGGEDVDAGEEDENERFRWLGLFDAFTDAAEGVENTPAWLDDLLIGGGAVVDDEIENEDEGEDGDEDDDLDWIFWTLTDEFMRAAWPAGTEGGGSGRSPDGLDEEEDYDPDHDPPHPRPKPPKPKPGRLGKN